MGTLADISDVEAGLGRSLATEEIPRANSLLILASAEVEAETRYRFAPGDYTITRKMPNNGRFRIPASVDSTVVAVRLVDQYRGVVTDLTAYTVHRGIIYGLYLGTGIYGYRPDQSFATLPYRSRLVEIDFTVATAIPEVIVALVAGIVASTMSGPPVGASAESAGPFRLSFVNSSGKVWLSASDKAILARYKQPKPAIDLTSQGL